jgi:hypothetical protein
MKIFCKANEGYCFAIHDGTLVLAPSDSCDEHQHWLRDMRLGTAVKDEEGNPVFSLVNKASRQPVLLSSTHSARTTQ